MNPIGKRGDFDAGPQGQENLNDVFYGLVEAGQHDGEQQLDAGMRFRRKRMGHGVTNEIQNPLFPRSAGFAALAVKLAASRHGTRHSARTFQGAAKFHTVGSVRHSRLPSGSWRSGLSPQNRPGGCSWYQALSTWAAVPRGVTVRPSHGRSAGGGDRHRHDVRHGGSFPVVTPQQDVEAGPLSCSPQKLIEPVVRLICSSRRKLLKTTSRLAPMSANTPSTRLHVRSKLNRGRRP